MKIQLLSYHFSDNYGALYQAYALREWFRKKGHEAEFLNYHPRYVEEGGNFDRILNPVKWKKNMTIAYLKVSHLYWRHFGYEVQRRAFEEFRRLDLGISGPRSFNAEELSEAVDCDMLVCGSDQIWNPSVQKGLDPVYFLQFPGAQRARRIAYAPSFGRPSLAEEYHAEAGKLIAGLDAVSVREDSGVNIVQQVSGRTALCVPDPTILLGDFSSLLADRPRPTTSYIFCYALRTDDVIREVAERVAERTGATLISPLSTRQRWKAIGRGVEPGPVEWLQLLNGAEMVVTNSFHGVALSIVLNRPFVAVALPGRKGAMDERVRHLLARVGLEGRSVRSWDRGVFAALTNGEIDWCEVNKNLEVSRHCGERYLERQMAMADQLAHG